MAKTAINSVAEAIGGIEELRQYAIKYEVITAPIAVSRLIQ